MKLPMQRFNLRLSFELLQQIDILADRLFLSRSEIIRQAIVDRIRAQPVSSLPHALPFNLSILTDEQLSELSQSIMFERRRRQSRRQRILRS